MARRSDCARRCIELMSAAATVNGKDASAVETLLTVLFEKIDPCDALAAVKEALARSRYLPSISEIMDVHMELVSSEASWRGRMAWMVRKSRECGIVQWNDEWGPPPWHDETDVPPAVLAEFKNEMTEVRKMASSYDPFRRP